MATTRPYYRSTYVFVTPRGRPPLTSFDDPRLPSLRIGIQLVGDDYQNPPAARALAARHLTNVRGFPVYGDYARAEPQREIVDAIARGDIDTAVVWGPIGGYFASRARVPMTVTPVSSADPQVGPVAFDIAIGVRPEDRERRAALDAALARRQADVQRILRSFAIPVVPLPD
jgi:mxaJ protein